MAILPMDIILSCILLKLPAKSLIRFKCVSKSFLAEISLPKFIELHHRNALSLDSNRLLIIPIAYMKLYIYDLDFPHTPPSICHYSKPVSFRTDMMKIVASCECYLLLGCRFTQLDDLILLNPSTHTYRELPNLPNPYLSLDILYGMCHCLDELGDDYKIARILEFGYVKHGCRREVMIYSLRSNTWKFVECNMTDDVIEHSGVLVQRHLLQSIFFTDQCPRLPRIGCFDMKAEHWTRDVPLPDIFLDDHGSDSYMGKCLSLGVLDGHLCFSVEDQNNSTSTCDFWVMKDYVVKESWVKLMSLHIPYGVDELQYYEEIYRPAAYPRGSLHELLCLRGACLSKLFWYDLRDKTFIDAEFDKVGGCSLLVPAYVCKGSHKNFSGGQPIRVTLFSNDVVQEDYDILEMSLILRVGKN